MATTTEDEKSYEKERIRGLYNTVQRSFVPLGRYMITLQLAGKIRGRCLDVGGHNGAFASLLKNEENDITIIDISSVALEVAKKRGFKVYVIDLSSDRFPFKDDTFDYIFCLETVEHLLNPTHCLQEIFRVLKKGGVLLISTPNNLSKSKNEYHANAWDYRNFSHYVETFGFKIEEKIGLFYHPRMEMFGKITHRFLPSLKFIGTKFPIFSIPLIQGTLILKATK